MSSSLKAERSRNLTYSILDPTGNITALVESSVDEEMQPSVAESLMRRHPEVEQVGFVRYFPRAGRNSISDTVDASASRQHDPQPAESVRENEAPRETVHVSLRMAGGEFCGNASMCAAALYLNRVDCKGDGDAETTVMLRVSGAANAVRTVLRRISPDAFEAGICMPPALYIAEAPFFFKGTEGQLPVVEMEGISHILIEPESAFYPLLRDKDAAGEAVRRWCRDLSADGLGLMFLDLRAPVPEMTPLVYVPGSGTEFWEHSCASGSAAAGMYLAKRCGAEADLTLSEPGGVLRVVSDPVKKETWLFGRTAVLKREQMDI